jgi:DHA3 family tetracycline resistance protein-like MFS transporter
MRKMDAYKVHLTRSAIYNFANTLIWTAMMIYQIQLVGLTPLQLVLVGTTMEITVFLFEIPTGIVADLYSRRLSVIIGFFMQGFSYLISGTIPTFAAILISQVIWGIGYTFTSGAYNAWMVDELGQERSGEAFIRSGQVARVVSIAAIPVSALLGSIHLAIPILLGGAGILITGVFLLLFMPENGFSPTPSTDRNTWQKMGDTFIGGLRVIRKQPALMSILAVGLFYGLYSEAWDRLWQIHLINGIGLPQFVSLQPIVWFSIIEIAEMGVSIVAGEALRRRLNMKQGKAMGRGLFWMTATMIGALVVYGLTNNFIIAMLAFFAFNVARGLTGPVYETWSNMHIDSNVRATVLSMQSQTDAIGQMVGGPPLGLIGERRLPLAFLASALILSPALWLLRRTERFHPVEETVEPAPIEA